MKQLILFFDGSCGPNNPNGNVGIGVVIYESTDFIFSRSPLNKRDVSTSYSYIKKIHEHSDYFKFGSPGFIRTSNNFAEHIALEYGLNWINKREEKEVFVFGDSELVINQMEGIYSLNQGKLYYPAAVKSMKAYNKAAETKEIYFNWIPRELNTIADNLSTKKSKPLNQ